VIESRKIKSTSRYSGGRPCEVIGKWGYCESNLKSMSARAPVKEMGRNHLEVDYLTFWWSKLNLNLTIKYLVDISKASETVLKCEKWFTNALSFDFWIFAHFERIRIGDWGPVMCSVDITDHRTQRHHGSSYPSISRIIASYPVILLTVQRTRFGKKYIGSAHQRTRRDVPDNMHHHNMDPRAWCVPYWRKMWYRIWNFRYCVLH
jgi:hypothetical protein